MLVRQLLSMKDSAGKPELESRTILTIKPDATVSEAVQMLAKHRIGAVVVSDDGETPTGILSERDVVRQLAAKGTAVLDSPISELMTREVQTCTTAEDALAILERMTKGRFRHLPVVDDGGRMIGVVSIGDAVSGRLKELAAEKDALTGMIMGN
ncbi:CBS domain-containing protein [Paracoccus sp. TK19116]|uniref:CBS domain-containing protein n=1 Tax=Paracoccus albicereus TaxID=2922394 RepID=A0ABT1MTP0_9RHOB|nr:CBS domain-containing protein [Paracoccus albicereus]MCQ0971699.1 CBS domain-containing protein [Paracoccus albicereus]